MVRRAVEARGAVCAHRSWDVLLARTFIHRKTLRFTKILVNRACVLRFLEPSLDNAFRGICVRETTDRSVLKTTCQSTVKRP
jgi:hypothetical protein